MNPSPRHPGTALAQQEGGQEVFPQVTQRATVRATREYHRSAEERRRGQARDPTRGRASPESLPQSSWRELASPHTPTSISHAGVEIAGACPTIVVGAWTHRPPRSPATAS